jgi:hypothetical protein
MPVYKLAFIYKQFNQGWTETFYQNTGSITNATSLGAILVPFLAATKSIHTQIQAFRATQVQPSGQRISFLQPLDSIFGQRADNAANQEFEQSVPDAMEIRLFGAQGTFGRTFLWRGLAEPDVWKDPASGVGRFSAGLRTAVGQLVQSLQNNTFQLPIQPAGNQKFPVSSMAADPVNVGETTATLIPANPGIAVGQVVRFQGVPVKNLPWLKGNWTVVRVSGAQQQQVNIRFTYQQMGVPSFAKMTVSVQSPNYSAISGSTILDLRSRKTGRPLSLTRGKSRGVRYRQ